MKKYTEEQKQFIADNVKGRTARELAKLVSETFEIDVSESAMKSFKAKYGLKSETKVGILSGAGTKLFPLEIKEFISQNYIGTGHKEMAELLNSTFGTNYTPAQMKSYYANNKMNSGLTGFFPKGNVPFNKGKKGVGGWEPTQFKKGQAPVNYRPVGTERINVDGYTEIKVADPNKWRTKHQIIWEAANGPIPKGHIVIFGDGNSQNLDINNLILITRRQLLILNRKRLIQKDADLTRSAVIVADIYSKISERKGKRRGGGANEYK